MQKSPKINHRKIFQKIIGNITFISLLNLLLLTWKKSNTTDLPRPKPKKPRKKITPELIFVIVIMLLVIITPILLYKTGCLDSTNYYNRRLA